MHSLKHIPGFMKRVKDAGAEGLTRMKIDWIHRFSHSSHEMRR